jgi:hypothetical protein
MCANNRCCTDDPLGPGTKEYKCVDKKTIVSAGGKSYLCDPPSWEVGETSEVKKEKQTIFDLFNFLRNLAFYPLLKK